MTAGVARPVAASRRGVVIATLAGLGAAGVGAIAAFGTSWVPPCPWASLTGLDCPGCGMTRAVHSLVRGDVADAVSQNPLMMLIGIPVLIVLAGVWLWRRRTPRWAMGVAPLVAWGVLVVAFTVARNLPVDALRPLASNG